MNESIKKPKETAAKDDLKGPFLTENGKSQITGQQGPIPFIFSQLGDAIAIAGKQIKVQKITIL